MTSSGELRALFSNARKLYVQGKFRQLLDLTAGVDGLSGQLKDNTLASGLRKLRWQAIARSNLEREEADRILAGTIQHPKDIAPDEVVHLLPALSPEQRRRVIKGFLAAQPPVFFDRVADRVEPENQLYTSLVEAYVLTSAPDSNDDTSEFLKVSLVGQEKKDLLRQVTGKGGTLPLKDNKAEVAVPSSEAANAAQTTASATKPPVASPSGRVPGRPTAVSSNKGKSSERAVASKRDRKLAVAFAASMGVLALLSIIMRKQLAKFLVILLTAVQRTLSMAMTRG